MNSSSKNKLWFTLISFAQSPERVLKKLGSNPVFFMDSVNVLQSDLQQYRPEEIASVTVFKDKEAIDILGEEGKDGVVYIETLTRQLLKNSMELQINYME